MPDGSWDVPPLPPSFRELIDVYWPDISDAEMVGHVTNNIDRLLMEVQTSIASVMLSDLCALDNPDVASQLEHYLNKVTYDEKLREKIGPRPSYMTPSLVHPSIDVFQNEALKNLLPLLDNERRDILVKDVTTNERYGRNAKQMVQGLYTEIMACEAEAQNSPKDETTNATDPTPVIASVSTKQSSAETESTQSPPNTFPWPIVILGIGAIAIIGGIVVWRKK